MSPLPPKIAVIGGGPAGLIAAETLAAAGAAVTVFERMPTVGRKLMMAGRGGLNLTHSEPLDAFLARYGSAEMAALVAAFPPAALIAWCEGLGQKVFTGSSGRVFPVAMKASPLLRAWLARLAGLGVTTRTRASWQGWDAEGRLTFAGGETFTTDAVVLAVGGASWPRLGSDGAWVAALPATSVAPLRPANCGFAVAWSEVFRTRFAGSPLKRIALSFAGRVVRGEAMISAQGIEGGAVYALSAALRDALEHGPVDLLVDLRPDLDAATLAGRLDAPRGSVSLANHLRRAGLPPVAVGLVQEALHGGATGPLSALVKALPLRLTAPFPIERAISTAGGVRWDEVDARLMLRRRPGVFVAGEMLDWEAPTGGYLLQGCFATGIAAANGVLSWLAKE
jgi:uncharacterized flavoprotein (TIGR03862 family)